jgi:inhibitor of KinA
MAGVPERIRLPRLETPRVKVPAGSVGLGGAQFCIYSVESPGGYWLLGRTPARLYDPRAEDPTLLRPGDRVRMRPVDRPEFEAIAAQVEAGTWRPSIT